MEIGGEKKDDENAKLNFEKDTTDERKEKLNKKLNLGIEKKPLYERKMPMARDAQRGMKKKKNINLLKKIDINVNKNKSNNQIAYLRLLKERNRNKEIRDDPDKLLNSLDINLTENMRKFYKELLEITKNPNRRVSVPARLFKDDIVINVFFPSQFLSKLSNDYLFMNYISYRYLSKDDIGVLGKNLSLVNIKNIKVVSNEFFINKDIFTSYYCEDFDRDLYANEYAVLDQSGKNDFKSIIEAENYLPTSLKINNVEYNVYETQPCLVIYKKGEGNNPNDLLALLAKGHAFRLEKGIFEKETKKFTILSNRYYFSSVLVPTNFCSSNAILPRGMDFDCLLRFSFNLDQYFNMIVKERKIQMVPNLMSWDNYRTVIEFFCWLYFMYKSRFFPQGNDIEHILAFENLEETYNKCNWYMDQWKIHYDNFKKIVSSFLDCFVNRIQLDKLERVSVACDTFLHDDDRLVNLKVYFDYMIDILALFGEGSEVMSNFLSKLRINVISAISFTSKKIYTMDDVGLRISIYSTGNLLYNILLSGKNPMINDIRSEALFLGSVQNNIYTDNDLEDQIKHMINIEKEKYAQKKEEYKENIINNAKYKELGLIMVQNSLQKAGIPEDDIPNLISIISSNWTKENRYANALSDYIDTLVTARKFKENEIKNMVLDDEDIELLGLLDHLLLAYHEIKQDKQQKIDQIIELVNKNEGKDVNVDQFKFLSLKEIEKKVNEMPEEEKQKNFKKIEEDVKTPIKRLGKRVRGQKEKKGEKGGKEKKGFKKTKIDENKKRVNEKFKKVAKIKKNKIDLASAPPIALGEQFKAAKNVIRPVPKKELKYDKNMNLSDLVQKMYDFGYIEKEGDLKLESLTSNLYEIPPYKMSKDEFENIMSDKLQINVNDTVYKPKDLLIIKLIEPAPSVFTNKEKVNGYIVPAFAMSAFLNNIAVEPGDLNEVQKIYNNRSDNSDFIAAFSTGVEEFLEGDGVSGLFETKTQKLYPIDKISSLRLFDSFEDIKERFFQD